MKRVAHNKFSKEKEDLIINDYNFCKSARQVSKNLKISKASVTAVLRRNNLKVFTFTELHGLKKEEKTQALELYKKGVSSVKIAKKLNTSKGTILRILEQNNFPKRAQNNDIYRKHVFNQNFFATIDTEEKAYFLGLLVSDGCVETSGKISISLQEKDKSILETFKTVIEYSGKLFFIERKPPTRQNMYLLILNSVKMSKDLQNLGLIQNKTYHTYFPNIPKYLYSHFIRGVFDGDGCISKSDNKYSFNIAGNKKLIEQIQSILIEECSLNITKLSIRKNKYDNFRVVVYSGNRQLKKIREYLYKDATVYIERKHKKFYEMTFKWKT